MKQRYHYNVSTQRLLVHVQKGWEDGLFVTCVASCDDLWAIVMDAGTEYTQQIYKVWGKCGGKLDLMCGAAFRVTWGWAIWTNGSAGRTLHLPCLLTLFTLQVHPNSFLSG